MRAGSCPGLARPSERLRETCCVLQLVPDVAQEGDCLAAINQPVVVCQGSEPGAIGQNLAEALKRE